jgi:hypothetical protein
MMCLCNGVGLSLTRIIDVSGVWNLGIVSWGGAVAKLERNRGGHKTLAKRVVHCFGAMGVQT